VFRVAQEAMTNTLKHATRPTAVQLALRLGADLVELEVSDSGGAVEEAGGDGRGLVGMRERASAYGGELEAGPRAGGGWRVRMLLPQEGGRR
jgi:signal transduction histidine kinase